MKRQKVMETKREIALRLLTDMFRERKRISIAEAVEAGQEQDVSRRTLQRACKELGVEEVHNGPFGAFWELR